MQMTVTYMDREMSAEGMRPTEEQVRAIREAPGPQNVQQLRSWLGMVNFQGQFVVNLATLAHPLHQLLATTKQTVHWKKECAQAFKAIKDAVADAALLIHFDERKPLVLAVDALPYGVGAALMHVFADGQSATHRICVQDPVQGAAELFAARPRGAVNRLRFGQVPNVPAGSSRFYLITNRWNTS